MVIYERFFNGLQGCRTAIFLRKNELNLNLSQLFAYSAQIMVEFCDFLKCYFS